MTVKDLYVHGNTMQSIILRDAFDNQIYWSGRFKDFPYEYAWRFVSRVTASGNKLVIEIYD